MRHLELKLGTPYERNMGSIAAAASFLMLWPLSRPTNPTTGISLYQNPADYSASYRKSPRSAPAAPSSTSAPSSVPPSM